MELTKKQITQLYKFTRKHFVEHYDVQTELVDHLANDIEQIWKTQPNLSFEEARDISFKNFGIFGFMNVVEEKQKQLSKKYIKIILGFVKEWFRLPKIILTTTIFFLFYTLQKLPNPYYIFVLIYSLIFISELIMMIRRKRILKNKFNKTGKKWMLEDIIESQGYGNIAFITFYCFQFFTPNNFENLNLIANIFVSSITTLAIIIGYITLFIIPKKATELLKNQYPEYNLI